MMDMVRNISKSTGPTSAPVVTDVVSLMQALQELFIGGYTGPVILDFANGKPMQINYGHFFRRPLAEGKKEDGAGRGDKPGRKKS